MAAVLRLSQPLRALPQLARESARSPVGPTCLCPRRAGARRLSPSRRPGPPVAISSRSVFGWMKDKLTERAQNKKAAKLVDQINLMANSPTWTIKLFANEIDETLSSWTSKMPGASRTTELQQAKETQIVVNAMMKHLGEKVTAGDIAKLDRKEKLKLAIACKKPMGDLNSVLDSFRHMEIIHRILRYRKANGLSLPTDEEGLKMAFRQDGMKVMTKEEKQEQRELYQKYASAKM